MILGIGTDLLNIKRLENVLKGESHIFLNKTFTREEQIQALSSSNPNHYYAARFSGKEAVFKTLFISGNYINLREIEILNNEIGIPCVKVTGKLKEIAVSKGIRDFKISFSSDGDYSLAFVIAHS